MNNLSPKKELSEIHKLVLQKLNEKHFNWVYLEDMQDIADYEILCKIVSDLYAYGFAILDTLKEVGFESEIFAPELLHQISGVKEKGVIAYEKNPFIY